MASLDTNPLATWSYGLSASSKDAPDLPRWQSITAEHVRPAITDAVKAVNLEIDAIEKKLSESKTPVSTWEEIEEYDLRVLQTCATAKTSEKHTTTCNPTS